MSRYQVKITVVNCAEPTDIFKDEQPLMPDGQHYKKCNAFKPGDVFVSERGRKPDNFCEWAWFDIYKDLQVLRFGGSFYPWIEDDSMYTCCTDGVRPVTFKLERITESKRF